MSIDYQKRARVACNGLDPEQMLILAIIILSMVQKRLQLDGLDLPF